MGTIYALSRLDNFYVYLPLQFYLIIRMRGEEGVCQPSAHRRNWRLGTAMLFAIITYVY